ncbi:hypothetical protein CXF70_14115 [Planomicrobium sp. MB-3u-38]|nr:hypothetical protein CXF70_14115 [Planomicrobium sp. MB-3u-38]
MDALFCSKINCFCYGVKTLQLIFKVYISWGYRKLLEYQGVKRLIKAHLLSSLVCKSLFLRMLAKMKGKTGC